MSISIDAIYIAIDNIKPLVQLCRYFVIIGYGILTCLMKNISNVKFFSSQNFDLVILTFKS